MPFVAPPVSTLAGLPAATHAAPRLSANREQPSWSAWHPLAGVFLVLFLGLLAFGRGSLLKDPGTFWHIRLGEDLLAGGQIATVDTFTFTHQGRPWLSLQWLGEAALAAANRVGGWDTVLLLTAAAIAGIYTWLAARLIRGGLHWLPAVTLMSLVIAASSHHFHARPHLASIAFLGVTFAWLCDVDSGRAGLRRLWLLAPLFVLWTNLHGGVLAGYATVALAVGGWGLLWLLGRPSPIQSARDASQAAVLLLVLTATFLVNPHGLEAPRSWLAILSLPLPDLIQEHQRLNLLRPEGIAVAVIALMYLVLLRSAWRGRRAGNSASLRTTWLLPLVWLVLAYSRVRHAPLFAIVAALTLVEMIPHSPLAEWLGKWEMFAAPKQPGQDVERRRWRAMLAAAIPALVVCVILALQALRVPVPIAGSGWARLDAGVWPVEIAPHLARIEQESPRARVLNSLHFGGFVEFHAPRLTTYIDDRCELFGADFLQLSLELESQPEKMLAEADRWQARYALVHAGSPADEGLAASRSWRLLARDAAGALYQRRE